MKIDSHKYQAIRKAISESDLPFSEIARKLGVSHMTVWNVSQGNVTPVKMYERCSICGALVKPPCVQCSTTRLNQTKRAACD
jgi:hypothetical protein